MLAPMGYVIFQTFLLAIMVVAVLLTARQKKRGPYWRFLVFIFITALVATIGPLVEEGATTGDWLREMSANVGYEIIGAVITLILFEAGREVEKWK